MHTYTHTHNMFIFTHLHTDTRTHIYVHVSILNESILGSRWCLHWQYDKRAARQTSEIYGTYTYIYICIYTYTPIYIFIYIYMYICTDTHTDTQTYIHICLYILTHICIYLYLRIYFGQPVVHSLTVRQACRVASLDRDCIRTGDRALVTFEFMFRPEYLILGARLIFREVCTYVCTHMHVFSCLYMFRS